MDNNKLQLFENKMIRTAWDEEKEEWYFSIVDVVAVLTEQKTQRGASTYWAVLKKRLKDEGAEQLLTNCKQLKMTAADGKKRLTDVATTEQLLRIIQSIPSPKAEPFKLWLAEVGRERIEETIDPEQAIDRALETYLKKGYTREWINQRLQAIQVRKELTDEWQDRGVKKGIEYAILTDEITRAWSGMTTRQYISLPVSVSPEEYETVMKEQGTTEIIVNELTGETAVMEAVDSTDYQYGDCRLCFDGEEEPEHFFISYEPYSGTYEIWHNSDDTLFKPVYEGNIYVFKGAQEEYVNYFPLIPTDDSNGSPGAVRDIAPEEGDDTPFSGNLPAFDCNGNLRGLYYAGD